MMTVELFVDTATPQSDARSQAERILAALTTQEGAPQDVLAKARELTHVVMHRPAVWVTGGPAEQPRYLVRITVPAAWSNDPGFASHVVPAVTAAIAGVEPDPGRLEREPHCVVQIVGVRENGLGVFGRPVSSTEVTRMLTQDFRDSGAAVDVPEGYAVDPVCGMAVDIASARFDLEHDGVRHVFCAPVCRKVFAEDLGLPA
ncbi:YHS domain-containing protein [Nocardia higoensis]|uniref:YHS domain-containing protein n=1 Tax=Nocardia higoensis TaxID=228599 RepID=UPI00031FC674|nr:YHS domain-containing protein [Nocardia higoensis]